MPGILNLSSCDKKTERSDKKMRKGTLWLGVSCLLVAALVLTGCPPAPQVDEVVDEVVEIETVTIRAWTIGPDRPAFYRAENLVLAADRLNTMLEASGANVRVEVEADFWTESWASYRKRASLTFAEGDPAVVPDIILSSHLDAPTWAEAGWIIPLDEYIEKYWDYAYQDFFPHLWEAVTWEGQIWAVPQDIEVRMVWYRKDHLRALGWTEEEINDLPRRVAEREFLLDDLLQTARELKRAGLVEYPIIHRPTAGPDFLQYVVAHGGEYFDQATGKLVIDRGPFLEMFRFFDRAVREQLLPSGMSAWAWPAVHTAIAVEGTAGFQITGGMWHWAEFIKDWGIPEEQLWKNLGWTLIPASGPEGTPNQLGHPLAYMVTAVSQNKDLAALLITLASSVELNTNHALTGAKLAIRRSQVAFAPFAEAEFLSAAAELLPYQIFSPAHPKTGAFLTIIHDAISGVQAGAMTPEGALDFLIERASLEIGDEHFIVR
ncbi:extracellular solute-binding protein [Dehalococcoidia bacterium]|nr:extracellular solute-binding protein [Dehalococcoidia bacterium]